MKENRTTSCENVQKTIVDLVNKTVRDIKAKIDITAGQFCPYRMNMDKCAKSPLSRYKSICRLLCALSAQKFGWILDNDLKSVTGFVYKPGFDKKDVEDIIRKVGFISDKYRALSLTLGEPVYEFWFTLVFKSPESQKGDLLRRWDNLISKFAKNSTYLQLSTVSMAFYDGETNSVKNDSIEQKIAMVSDLFPQLFISARHFLSEKGSIEVTLTLKRRIGDLPCKDIDNLLKLLQKRRESIHLSILNGKFEKAAKKLNGYLKDLQDFIRCLLRNREYGIVGYSKFLDTLKKIVNAYTEISKIVRIDNKHGFAMSVPFTKLFSLAENFLFINNPFEESPWQILIDKFAKELNKRHELPSKLKSIRIRSKMFYKNNVSVKFNDAYNLIMGLNASGKTTIVQEIVSKFIGDDLIFKKTFSFGIFLLKELYEKIDITQPELGGFKDTEMADYKDIILKNSQKILKMTQIIDFFYSEFSGKLSSDDAIQWSLYTNSVYREFQNAYNFVLAHTSIILMDYRREVKKLNEFVTALFGERKPLQNVFKYDLSTVYFLLDSMEQVILSLRNEFRDCFKNYPIYFKKHQLKNQKSNYIEFLSFLNNIEDYEAVIRKVQLPIMLLLLSMHMEPILTGRSGKLKYAMELANKISENNMRAIQISLSKNSLGKIRDWLDQIEDLKSLLSDGNNKMIGETLEKILSRAQVRNPINTGRIALLEVLKNFRRYLIEQTGRINNSHADNENELQASDILDLFAKFVINFILFEYKFSIYELVSREIELFTLPLAPESVRSQSTDKNDMVTDKNEKGRIFREFILSTSYSQFFRAFEIEKFSLKQKDATYPVSEILNLGHKQLVSFLSNAIKLMIDVKNIGNGKDFFWLLDDPFENLDPLTGRLALRFIVRYRRLLQWAGFKPQIIIMSHNREIMEDMYFYLSEAKENVSLKWLTPKKEGPINRIIDLTEK